MFKIWGVGDITKKELGEQVFNHIEAPEGNDINNHITLQRALRNLYEMQRDTIEVMRDIISTSTRASSVFKKGDLEPEIVDQVYFRVKPGIAFANNNIFVNRPLIHNASRQLEEILKLNTWTIDDYREYVEISYDEANDTFSAIIKAKTGNDFSIYPFEDHASGLSLLKAIKNEAAFTSSFSNIDLTDIKLEPIFTIGSGGYLMLSNEGELYYTSTPGDSDLLLYEINSNGEIIEDNRAYLEKYNQFEGGIELNKKNTIGDSDASIIVRKSSGGDAVIKWEESEERFKINKNFQIDGATTLKDNLTVEIGKKTTLGGDLEVNGSTSFKDTLKVATGKKTTLGGALEVSGATEIRNTLKVVGDKKTTLGGDLEVNGSTLFKGNISLENGKTINGLTIEKATGNTLDLSKASLTVGDTNKTGKIIIKSDDNEQRTITIKGDTVLEPGNTLTTENARSMQAIARDQEESTAIPIPPVLEFDPERDTLIVYENYIYFLQLNRDYVISDNGEKIEVGRNYHKEKFEEGDYSFMVIKNIRNKKAND